LDFERRQRHQPAHAAVRPAKGGGWRRPGGANQAEPKPNGESQGNQEQPRAYHFHGRAILQLGA
jgi:hypothetical protein